MSNNVQRRLRQHNGELVGGARITHTGRPWLRVCYMTNFPTQRVALQFEWKWKSLSRRGQPRSKTAKKRRKNANHPPLVKWGVAVPDAAHAALRWRLCALLELVRLPKFTESAPPTASLTGLTLVWSDPSRPALANAIKASLPPNIDFRHE